MLCEEMLKKSLQTVTTDRLLPLSVDLMIRSSSVLIVLVCAILLCSCSQIRTLYTKDSPLQSKENRKYNTLLSNQQVNESQRGQSEDTSIVGSRSSGKADDLRLPYFICRNDGAFLPPFDSLPLSKDHEAKVLELQIVPFGSERKAGLILSIDAVGKILLRRISALDSPRLLITMPEQLDLVAFDMKRLLLAAASGRKVNLYSLLGQESMMLSRLESHVTSLDFSPTEHALLMGGADGRVYRWNYCLARTGLLGKEPERVIDRYIGHGSVVSAVRYHPFGRFFFSGDWRGSFRAWLNYGVDAADWQKDSFFSGQRFFTDRSTSLKIGRSDQERVAKIATSSDGRYIAVALYSGKVELWQVRGMRNVLEFQAHRGLILALAISPSGAGIVSAGRDGRLKVWRVNTSSGTISGTLRYSVTETDNVEWPQVENVTFLDEDYLVGGDVAGNVKLFQLPKNLQGEGE